MYTVGKKCLSSQNSHMSEQRFRAMANFSDLSSEESLKSMKGFYEKSSQLLRLRLLSHVFPGLAKKEDCLPKTIECLHIFVIQFCRHTYAQVQSNENTHKMQMSSNDPHIEKQM